MLYGQLYVTFNIEKHRIGNIVILTRIIRSHDNFFKSLDKVSKYQIKGDGKQSRINCLDRKIRDIKVTQAKRYMGFYTTHIILGGKYIIQHFRPISITFMQQTNISFFQIERRKSP